MTIYGFWGSYVLELFLGRHSEVAVFGNNTRCIWHPETVQRRTEQMDKLFLFIKK